MSDIAKETTKEKAERLDNWRPLDVHRWSDYPEINKTVDLIYKEFEGLPDFKGKPNIQKKHIKVIIIDLYAAFLEDSDKYIGVYRGVNYYKGKSRYNKLHITKLTPAIIDRFIESDYIEQVKGHYDATGNTPSHMTRIIHTNKLKELWSDSGFRPEMVLKAPNTECVILRKKDNKKKIDIDYDDDPVIIDMRNRLYRYNNLLRCAHIWIPSAPKSGIPSKREKKVVHLSHHDKFVRRIFSNGTFEDGGRFYGGWWQRINSDWREKIFINKSPVVEVDYSGLHIVLLYALEDIDYWLSNGNDPYEIEDLEKSPRMRKLLKLCLLCMLNAGNRKEAKQAIQFDINKSYKKDNEDNFLWVNEEGINLDEIMVKFISTHTLIDKYFNSGIGIKLQKIDSMISEKIIDRFTNDEIPVLCVHDSFIISANHEDELDKAMDNCIKETVKKIFPDLKEVKTKREGLRGQKWNNLFRHRDVYEDYETTLGVFDDLVGNLKKDYPDYCRDYEEFRQLECRKDYYVQDEDNNK